MDRDTQVTLHRRKLGQLDRVTTRGRAEDMIRQFKARPSGEKTEYSLMDGEMEYSPHEIEELADRLGIK
jgi:hypothetical protein